MTRLRPVIAERMVEAQQTAAMLTTFNEVDLTEVMALRQRYKETFEKEHAYEARLHVVLQSKAAVEVAEEVSGRQCIGRRVTTSSTTTTTTSASPSRRLAG